MEIRILGCSGGRSPGFELSSYLVDGSLLIDTGGAASSLSLAEQENISDILITHAHLDHILGIGFIYQNTWKSRVRALDIHATEPVIRVIREHLLCPEVMPLESTGVDDLTGMRFLPVKPEKPFQVGAYEAEAFPVFHTPGSVAYRLSDSAHTVVYTGDTGVTDRVWRWINKRGGVDILIAEASFPNRMSELAHLSRHLTPKGLVESLKKADVGPDRKVHVVHLKPAFLGELMDDIDAERGFNLAMARKGDVIRSDHDHQEHDLHVPKRIRDKLVEFDSGADLYDQRDKLSRQFGIEVKKGDYIFRQGDKSKEMYIIQEGRVRIVREAGKTGKTLSVLADGDFFGEMAMLNNRPRSASAVAITEVKLLAFDGAAFEKLVLENFGVALRLIRTLSERLQHADIIIENLLFLDPKSKVVNTLIQSAYNEGIETGEGLQLRITPEEIEDLSGVVMGTLREVMADLAGEGMIVARRETIVIPNISKMRRLLKFIELRHEFA